MGTRTRDANIIPCITPLLKSGVVPIGIVGQYPIQKVTGSQAPSRTLTLLAPLTTCRASALIPDDVSTVWHTVSPAAAKPHTPSYKLSRIALTSISFAIMDLPPRVQA
jgi:hypothetical protein